MPIWLELLVLMLLAYTAARARMGAVGTDGTRRGDAQVSELVGQNWWLLAIALAIGLVVAWWIFVARAAPASTSTAATRSTKGPSGRSATRR